MVTNSVLTVVQNKIPDINLVKETDYQTKTGEIEKEVTEHIHDKYITNPEFNKFTVEVFEARLARENLVTKKDFDAKLIGFNKIINSSKTKHLLAKKELKNYKHLIQFIF